MTPFACLGRWWLHWRRLSRQRAWRVWRARAGESPRPPRSRSSLPCRARPCWTCIGRESQGKGEKERELRCGWTCAAVVVRATAACNAEGVAGGGQQELNKRARKLDAEFHRHHQLRPPQPQLKGLHTTKCVDGIPDSSFTTLPSQTTPGTGEKNQTSSNLPLPPSLTTPVSCVKSTTTSFASWN
jgi:hypothetical protein